MRHRKFSIPARCIAATTTGMSSWLNWRLPWINFRSSAGAFDPENRAVTIVAESDDFYRSSEIPLDGDKAPRTTTFEFRSLPPGIYEVRARLTGAGGEERGSVRRSVNVISSAGGR